MAHLLYAVICIVLLFALSEGKTVYRVTTYSLVEPRRLEYSKHNLPAIHNQEIDLSVKSCGTVTIYFSQVDVSIYQNMFAVTLSSGGIGMKSGHKIHELKHEHSIFHKISMCVGSSRFRFSWKGNMMRIFKECKTQIFAWKLPRTSNNYSYKFITVTSTVQALWTYGDVCVGNFLPSSLMENHGTKDFYTSSTTGYLPLKGIRISPSFTFKVKGCGKLALTFHAMKRVSAVANRVEIEIDNKIFSSKTSFRKGFGTPLRNPIIIVEKVIRQRQMCTNFRTFRVKFVGNILKLEGCDGMSEKHLLSTSDPRYRYASVFSVQQVNWSFGVTDFCNSNKEPVGSLPAGSNGACNRGFVLKGATCVGTCKVDADCSSVTRCCGGVCSSKKCSKMVSGTTDSVRSKCDPTAGFPACTTNAVNRGTEGSTTKWGDISNTTTGHMATVIPYPLVTGTTDDVIDIEGTTVPVSSLSGNFSYGNSTSSNSSYVAEQFQEGMEQISKALGSTGFSVASFTVNKLIFLVCICTFVTYPL